MRHLSRLSSTAVLGLLLAACGGNGGPAGVNLNSSSPPFDPAPGVDFNVLAAWRNFLTSNRTWTITGPGSDGNVYTVTIETTAAAAATFPATGEAASSAQTTLRIAGGGLDTTLLQSTFFDPAGLQVTGLVRERDGTVEVCGVATESTVPPPASQIPSSGPLATLELRGDCAPGGPAVAGTLLHTWSLDHVDGIDLFCLNTHVLDTADPPRRHCVEVRPDGSLGDGAFVSLEFGPLDAPITIEAASP